VVDNYDSIKERDQRCLDMRLLRLDFLLPRRIRYTPLPIHASSLRFRIKLKTPTVIANHNRLYHVMIIVNKFNENVATFDPLLTLINR
jgi:hypothetical protein